MKKTKTLVAVMPDSRLSAVVKLAAIAFFASAMAFGALVRIPLPFTPVPITLQTYFALLAGLTLGSTAGVASICLYLVLGTAGMPLFTGSASGPVALFGPTGGYLLGFVTAAFITGFASSPTVSHPLRLACLASATVVILLMGTVVLSLYTGTPLITSFRLGALPFIPGDIIKMAAALGTWHTGRVIQSRLS